jgi:ATP-dependent Lon protease
MTTDPGVRKLPILPLRNSVLLPGSAMPSRVSRVQSIALIEAAVAGGLMVGVVAQREPTVDDPGQADLYQVGTVANLSRLPGDSPNEPCVLLRGISRFRIVEVVQTTPYLWAYVEDLPDVEGDEAESETLFAQLQALAETVIRQLVPEPHAALEMIAAMDNLAEFASLMCANLEVATVEKQRVLATSSIVQRAQLVIGLLERMRTGVTPTAQQAPTSYFVTKPLSRAAFLAKAAELGWIFADRTPSTVK